MSAFAEAAPGLSSSVPTTVPAMVPPAPLLSPAAAGPQKRSFSQVDGGVSYEDGSPPQKRTATTVHGPPAMAASEYDAFDGFTGLGADGQLFESYPSDGFSGLPLPPPLPAHEPGQLPTRPAAAPSSLSGVISIPAQCLPTKFNFVTADSVTSMAINRREALLVGFPATKAQVLSEMFDSTTIPKSGHLPLFFEDERLVLEGLNSSSTRYVRVPTSPTTFSYFGMPPGVSKWAVVVNKAEITSQLRKYAKVNPACNIFFFVPNILEAGGSDRLYLLVSSAPGSSDDEGTTASTRPMHIYQHASFPILDIDAAQTRINTRMPSDACIVDTSAEVLAAHLEGGGGGGGSGGGGAKDQMQSTTRKATFRTYGDTLHVVATFDNQWSALELTQNSGLTSANVDLTVSLDLLAEIVSHASKCSQNKGIRFFFAVDKTTPVLVVSYLNVLGDDTTCWIAVIANDEDM